MSEIPFILYKSSGINSSFGDASDTYVSVSTLFPSIQAYGPLTDMANIVDPNYNACVPGTMYRKIFVHNISNYQLDMHIVASQISGENYKYYIADSDNMEPIQITDYSEDIQVTLLPGDMKALAIRFSWPENSGEDDKIGFDLSFIVGDAEYKFVFRHTMDPYIELPGQSENDYSSKLKDIFICFLRSALYRFYRPDLRWNPYPEYTRIFIADRLTYNIDDPDFRPSIIVVRGDLRWREMVIDQRLSVDMQSGKKTYTDLILFNIMMQCIAREGLHAEFLGVTIFKMLRFYKDAIRKAGIHDIQGVSMGQEVNIVGDSRPEAIMIPLSISGCIQDKWSALPIGPPEFTGVNILIDATKGVTRTIIIEDADN